ncbi:MAG: hypothetical protein ACLR7K_14765 [Subdoligranulum sp.]
MQKKVSAAVRAFGSAHKAGLALLGGGVAALGVFWAARRSACGHAVVGGVCFHAGQAVCFCAGGAATLQLL